MSGQSTYYNGSKEWVRNFLCPISLELMRNPVIVTSRQHTLAVLYNNGGRVEVVAIVVRVAMTCGCGGGDEVDGEDVMMKVGVVRRWWCRVAVAAAVVVKVAKG
ncbi:hypothetical protein Tco_1203406 [Tanacetum coccineum]